MEVSLRRTWASVRPVDEPERPAVPGYYRHRGGKYRDKAAVGMGKFEASKASHFSSRSPRLGRQALSLAAHRRAVGGGGLNSPPQTPPPVQEDWDDFPTLEEHREAFHALGSTPLSSGAGPELLRPQMTPLKSDGLSTPRFFDEGKQQSGSGRISQSPRAPHRVTCSALAEERLGILPLPKNQVPTFGYGDHLRHANARAPVSKGLPPCAVDTTTREVKDIPAEERFLTTHKDKFKASHLQDFRPATNDDYWPIRFMPAGNRRLNETAKIVAPALYGPILQPAEQTR
eukprot:TRINITY_DN26925_c0_g1_i1.p1 TRINITY_DN26925_c0_g1~~TRINITY_DN26925_c0_g1_i1.p1  ORF type:complete len:287 (-),score=43.97 TRINITY_DN26925_c0_g1_i1:72-932(-)